MNIEVVKSYWSSYGSSGPVYANACVRVSYRNISITFYAIVICITHMVLLIHINFFIHSFAFSFCEQVMVQINGSAELHFNILDLRSIFMFLLRSLFNGIFYKIAIFFFVFSLPSSIKKPVNISFSHHSG